MSGVKNKSRHNIYEYFSEYTEEQIDTMLSCLSEKHINMLHKYYGEDFHNPVINKEITKKEKNTIDTYIFEKMKKLLSDEEVIPSMEQQAELPKRERKIRSNIYEYFSEYPEEQIDTMLSCLSEKYISMLHKYYGEDFHNPVINKEITKKEKVFIDTAIFKKMNYLLENPKAPSPIEPVVKLQKKEKRSKKSRNNIYEYFSEYTEEQVDKMLSSLSEKYISMLHKYYGEDFHNPVINKNITKKEKVFIDTVIFKKMKDIMEDIALNSAFELSEHSNKKVEFDITFLESLYSFFAKSQSIKYDDLIESGYDNNVIDVLLKQNILILTDDVYDISSSQVDNLFGYFKNCISLKKYNLAQSILSKCYVLDSKNPAIVLSMFYQCLNTNNAEDILRYYDEYASLSNDMDIKHDCNFYLYLLSHSFKLPEKYVKYVYKLGWEDICICENDKRFTRKKPMQQMRTATFKGQFSNAYNILCEYESSFQSKMFENTIIKRLLEKVINEKRIDKDKLLSYLRNEKYEEMLDMYNDMMSRHPLSFGDKYCRLLTQIIIDKNIPMPNVIKDDYSSIYEAIDNNDFIKAYELSKDYNNLDKNIMHILLRKLSTEQMHLTAKCQEEKIEQVDILIDTDKSNTDIMRGSFHDIVVLLEQGKVAEALCSIRLYLSSKGSEKYLEFILNLMRIDILNDDTHYLKTMMFLADIENVNLFDTLGNIIESFYVSLSKKDLELASIYLNAIINLDILGATCEIKNSIQNIYDARCRLTNRSITTNRLKQFENDLNLSEKLYEYYKDHLHHNTNIIAEEKTSVSEISNDPIEPQIQGGPIVTKKISHNDNNNNNNQFAQISKLTDSNNKSETIQFETLFDKNIEQKVKQYGIVLFDPMTKEQVQQVLKSLKSSDSIKVFSVGSKDKKRIVLKNRLSSKENVKDLITEATHLYKEKKYGLALPKMLHILSIVDNVSPSILFQISICYAALSKTIHNKSYKKAAIQYAILVDELNKERGYEPLQNIEDYILGLQGYVAEEDYKLNFKVTENDFEDDVVVFSNYEELKQLVLIEKMSINEVIEQNQLSEEDGMLFSLYICRELYKKKLTKQADKLLQEIHNKKKKSPKVLKLQNEILNRRKFY